MQILLTTREKIVIAAEDAGWTVDPGFKGRDATDNTAGFAAAGPDGKHITVEFSARGGLTWAHTATDRFDRNRLAQVLAYITG